MGAPAMGIDIDADGPHHRGAELMGAPELGIDIDADGPHHRGTELMMKREESTATPAARILPVMG